MMNGLTDNPPAGTDYSGKSDAFHQKRITRGATVFGAATLFSRVLGLGRDVLFAGIFGTGVIFSSFLIAYQIPNMFRKLFGEGALSGAFVPVFTEHVHEEGHEKGMKFAGTVFTFAGMILIFLTLAGMVIYQILAWMTEDIRIDLIAPLGQIMLPYMFFICIAGLGMGVLNTYNHFAIPALSPALLNIVLISTMLWFMPCEDGMTKAYAIAVAVLIGGVLQFIVQIPVLRRKGFRYRLSFDFHDPYLRKMLKIYLPGLFSLAITQVNVVLDSLLSFLRSEQAPAELAYANRLLQLPLGIFGVGLAAATLPALSKLRAAGRIEDFRKTFSYSVRQVLAITIPSSIGLIILAHPIIRLLFQHGKFSINDTLIVSRVLVCYVIGLFAYSTNKIIIPAFLAFQDSKTPMRLGVVSTLVNLSLNIIIILTFTTQYLSRYVSTGFATTTAIAGIVYLALLLYALRRKIGRIRGREIMESGIKITASSLAMGIVAYISLFISRRYFDGEDYFSRIVLVCIPMASGLIAHVIFSLVFRVKEFRETCSAFRRRRSS